MEKDKIISIPVPYILRLLKNAGNRRKEQEDILLGYLQEESREDYRKVLAGERLPDLMADVIAKKIFHPQEHPDRLEYLLRQVANDDSIVIDREAMNEGYTQSVVSKKLIFDLTAWLSDGRISGTEFQKLAQDFIMERTEIYVSDLLLMQYSAKQNRPKSETGYENVKGVLQVVLMKHSPDFFNQPEVGERYIHRFSEAVSDSGLVYREPIKKTVFVQLDKCFEQFLAGRDGENNPPLQVLLAALYNVNDALVQEKAQTHDLLPEIFEEVQRFCKGKEVQAMLLCEKYAEADLNAVKSYERRHGMQEGRKEGRKEGQTILVKAVERLKNGESINQLLASGIDQQTIDSAMLIRNLK